MRLASLLRVGAASLVLALAWHGAGVEFDTIKRERLTTEVCELVDNYLETSSVRSAFEGIQQAIDRTSYGGACISIIEGERNYGPDCLNLATHYQLTVCKAEGNRGIRAEIRYPIPAFFHKELLASWLILWVVLCLILYGLRLGASYFTGRLTDELKERLFGKNPLEKRQTFLGRFATWFLTKSRILNDVHDQTRQFESQIREFESRARVEAILRAQKEVEVQKSRERLDEIKTIRHDLGSPLSSFLSVQESFVGDELSRQALASGIRQIHNMLDRLEQSEVDTEASRLTIVEVVAEETVALLSSKFQGLKQIQLSLVYDSNNLSPISAVPGGLMRMFNNLLENAFDASPAGALIRIRIESTDGFCRFLVEDSGCGVPLEVVPRLFEKGATYGKINGTGYGLHQCMMTIKAWNGTITMEPLAPGARFIVTLPKLQAGVTFVGLPSVKRIWVIDDDRSVAEKLDASSFEVVESALTFEEGRALLRKPIPGNVAVLVDFRLNDRKLGTDLIAGHLAIRQMYLCTNDFDNPDVVRKARQVGVRILPKPLCLLAKSIAGEPAPSLG